MNISSAYDLREKRYLEDIGADAYLLTHKKTGARLFIIENDDNNKVFSIAFRTPPVNDCGLTHILEHSVLCGSKEFPVKDPFVELAKGSMNTFLNAMTYPDMTVYPVASCNDKDFQNLMHVYLDAVFYPNIYDKEEIFRQEGWHYELESKEGELTYNGVVYNEMKGAFSSPEGVLERENLNSLFPDTPYHYESGGDPDFIPELSYEEFLDFHRKYYHPSNSFIYLYGDADMEEKLGFLDEHYLSNFDKIEIDTVLPLQKAFDKPVRLERTYSVTEDEDTAGKTYLSMNICLGDSLDRKLYQAFGVLDYVLASSPGAPLKQALIDAGIGEDVFGSYEPGLRQMMYSVIAKNTDASKEEEFVKVIRDTLQKLCKEGIDKRMLLAAINISEFRYREADSGRFPIGLFEGLSVMDSWLYDEADPFMHLMEGEIYAFLRENVDTGYFEELIKKYMLDNPHKSVVVTKPERGLTAKNENEIKEKLAKYKASLSNDEIENIIKNTAHLKAYQSEPSPKEDLEKIPLLSLEDMKKEPEPFSNRVTESGGTTFLHHDFESKGIAYISLIFDTKGLTPDEQLNLGVLQEILGLVDTEKYAYKELSSETNIHTGGIGSGLSTGVKLDEAGSVYSNFNITAKALYPNVPKAFELMEEIIVRSKLDDDKRIKEILLELRSRLQMMINSAGHSIASMRGMSYFSKSADLIDRTGGISFYDYVTELTDNFDERKQEFKDKLRLIMKKLFRADNLTADITAKDFDDKEFEELVLNLKKSLYEACENPGEFDFPEPVKKNEGFKTASKVNYVARCGNFKKAGFEYTGSLKVLRVIMSYEYLWQNIRVLGGAYGCMSAFDRNGDSYFVSYRDPHIEETNKIYENIPAYLENFDIDERDMVKYIIGTFSSMDTPLNPSAKGARSRAAYFTGLTMDTLRKERSEVLNTKISDIRALCPLVRSVLDGDCICVIGDENAVEKCGDKFKNIRTLR